MRREKYLVVRVPIPTEEQLLGPVHPEQIREATAAIRPGTFVHCEHGQDRTGLIVAIHRVQADGWTKADAEGEMLAHGFHKQLHGLWEYWESFRLERPRETTNETSVPR